MSSGERRGKETKREREREGGESGCQIEGTPPRKTVKLTAVTEQSLQRLKSDQAKNRNIKKTSVM